MRERGFANIEFQLLIAIIGILLAIAIPKFAELIRRSNEAATRGNLGAVRAALELYRRETNGRFPYHPDSLVFGGRYLKSMPSAKTPPHHPDSSRTRIGTGPWDADDTGGWLYVGDPSAKTRGAFVVNCTHTDAKGKLWSSY